MSRKSETWRYSRGRPGETVAVEERVPGSNVHLRWVDPDWSGQGSRYKRESLGYTVRRADGSLSEDRVLDATKACDDKYWTLKRTAEFVEPTLSHTRELTLRWLVNQHDRQYAARHCRRSTRKMYRRTGKALVNFFGAERNPRDLMAQDLQGYLDAREKGAIDAHGRSRRHPEYNGAPCGPRGRAKDLAYVRALYRWAMAQRDAAGRPVIVVDPTVTMELPRKHKSKVRQPVATHERYEILRVKAEEHEMEVRWEGSREATRSYVADVLDIVRGTGRRISEVCAIEQKDVHLEEDAIHWPGDKNKTGNETTVAINRTARQGAKRALERAKELAPFSPWLFPAPGDPREHVTKDLVSGWLRKVEEDAAEDLRKAGLPATHDGSLWHAYRRLWATERKHLPLKDVAAAGGWESTEALLRCYTQVDEETIENVVNTGAAA